MTSVFPFGFVILIGTMKAKVAVSVSVHGTTAIVEFKTQELMSLYMDDVSSVYEGKLSSNRIGHNFPLHVLKGMMKGQPYQLKLYELIVGASGAVDYVVGYLSGDVHTKQHELRHAMYYCDVGYRAKVLKAWNALDTKTRGKIEDFLAKLGYPESVMVDEFQAYYFTERRNFFGLSVMLPMCLP